MDRQLLLPRVLNAAICFVSLVLAVHVVVSLRQPVHNDAAAHDHRAREELDLPFSNITSIPTADAIEIKPILESTYTKYLGKGCPLQELGLSVSGNENVDLQATHEGPINQGSQYKPTQAKYYEVYNPAQGAIIAYRNYGPAKYAELDENWNDAPLPGSKQWSDVVFLSWADITTKVEMKKSKYVIRSSVQNQDTLDVVEKALKKEGIASGRAPVWPGYTFKPGSQSIRPFQAVLGTPNASGVVWLLAQHREFLGFKTITAIRVWDKSGLENQDAGILLGMVLYIRDVQS